MNFKYKGFFLNSLSIPFVYHPMHLVPLTIILWGIACLVPIVN